VLIFRHPLTTIQWMGTLLVFAGLAMDSAFGKANRHKTASQKNGSVDVRMDKMMVSNGLVVEDDMEQQMRGKLKTN